MAYTYPIDPKAMFEDRRGQFIGFGVPAADVAKLEGAITDMWANAPGGWVYEWSALARRYLSEGQHYLASLAYGCAKFPCLADQAKAAALDEHPSQPAGDNADDDPGDEAVSTEA